MSGKFQKKTKKKKNKLPVVLGLFAIVLVAVIAVLLLVIPAAEETDAPETNKEVTNAVQPETSQLPGRPEMSVVGLGRGMYITDAGSYTGIYMEDGTDELASGILMLVVKNEGNQDIQYAEITLPTDKGDAFFTLSTLPAGESVVLLEKNRMEYTGQEDIAQATADHVAVFSEPLSLYEDQLKLQILDGAINVSNISGADINGDVVIYYKNAAADLYYGGITYRVRIEGGIKAGEIKQLMASHFSETGSKIMFVTVG